VGRREAGACELKVRLISVGKDRSGLFEPGVREYAKRLAHYAKFELLELPEAPRHKTPEQAKAAEATALLGKVSDRDWLVAMDERGELWSSTELAAFFAKAQQAGRDLVFVIGGDEGLSEEVRGKAKQVLSLSRMTLPHRMARLVLAEQLYRAFTILKGEPYHK
jgi:23S rRNA (pseudouridine1915-N3)-methyltransferase